LPASVCVYLLEVSSIYHRGENVNVKYPFKRRDSLTISIAILKAAKYGVRKTQLLSSASLSFTQFTTYAEMLEARGFLRRFDSSYQTTRMGLELIKEVESSSLIRSILAS
jgi:predicted transcriptional regulator